MLDIILSKYYRLNLFGSLGAVVSLLISFSSSRNLASVVCLALPCPALPQSVLMQTSNHLSPSRLFISVDLLRDQNHLSVELDAILSFIFQSNIHNCSFKYWKENGEISLNRL